MVPVLLLSVLVPVPVPVLFWVLLSLMAGAVVVPLEPVPELSEEVLFEELSVLDGVVVVFVLVFVLPLLSVD